MGKNLILIMACGLLLFGCKTTSHTSKQLDVEQVDKVKSDSTTVDVSKTIVVVDNSLEDKVIIEEVVEYDTEKPIVEQTGNHPIKIKTTTTTESKVKKDIKTDLKSDSTGVSIQAEIDKSVIDKSIDTKDTSDSSTPLKHVKNTFLYIFLTAILLFVVFIVIKFSRK